MRIRLAGLEWTGPKRTWTGFSSRNGFQANDLRRLEKRDSFSYQLIDSCNPLRSRTHC